MKTKVQPPLPKIPLYNSITNIADSGILNAIADAFTEIERHGLKVEKITLEKAKYEELITRKGCLNYLCLNNHGLEITEEQALVGALWGAPLEIGKESKVYGERGFMSSGLYFSESENIHNVNYRMETKIKFPAPMTTEAYRFQQKVLQLKSNMIIIVKTRARPLYGDIPKNEMTAIDTLKEIITEVEFRKYMVHGFILVKGVSGRIYQIFRGRTHTVVWENGKVIEEICVHIKNWKIPPTDSVIALKILIEASEADFKSLGNVYNMRMAA